MSVRVALIGCGAWGTNICRVLLQNERARLVAVADLSKARRDLALSMSSSFAVVSTLDEAIALGVEAVCIATPPRTHVALTLHALDAGLDVFVEKPLALTAADADRCVEAAASLGRIGMVGHLLRYHPTIERLVSLVKSGELGPLLELHSSRLSMRGDRSVSALWSLGPHDLSVLHAIEPLAAAALSVKAGVDGDPVELGLRFPSGLSARIELSRVNVTKERRLCLTFGSRVAVFDDVRAPSRILVGDRGFVAAKHDMEIDVPFREPLALELDHFLRCVEEREAPRTSFDEGAAVVRLLGQATEALRPESTPLLGVDVIEQKDAAL